MKKRNELGRVGRAMCLALTTASWAGSEATAAPNLTVTNRPNDIVVSWTSESVTRNTPFLHYEFQVQASPDLNTWTNLGALLPGGAMPTAMIARSQVVSRAGGMGFYRLAYRLNLPGNDLSGADFTGANLRTADLSNANLSGANLNGTDLSGAQLTGAILTGATFGNATLNGVNLNGLNLQGLDLSKTLGTPGLTQVTAAPAGSASQLVPRLAYNADPRDLVTDDHIPGIVSARNAMVMLKTNVTVGQLNTLLAAHNGSIVGSSPQDALMSNAVLMVRFPTTTARELLDLTVALSRDPIVEASAPDVLVGTTEIPPDRGAVSGWRWDSAGHPEGGNWGLEYARVPQMWNLVSALETRGGARVPTCILDIYFTTHDDVPFERISGLPLPVDDHGMHVAGIVGATHGNDRGIDGVNPFAVLTGYNLSVVSSDFPGPNAPAGGWEPGPQAGAYRMVQDVRDILRADPTIRIINMSLGFNWYLITNSTRPEVTDPFTPTQHVAIAAIAPHYGRLMAEVAKGAAATLIVCAAGNDYGLIPVRMASPMCNASHEWGAQNILVVGSHGITGELSSFSNRDADVAAPGEGILSAQGSNANAYATFSGTSMAAPFISGLAGFLMAVDPTLGPSDIISLVQKDGLDVDAFTSLMEIDALPGHHSRTVLKLLLDVDDSSPDGSLRVEVPAGTRGRDRAFQQVAGLDYNYLNHAVGDGVIDMSDFRRWRDWLLYTEGGHGMNGSRGHLKFDGNANFISDPLREKNYFSRGDFNGDGLLDRLTPRSMAGSFFGLAVTDLEALAMSGLWEDQQYTDELIILDLIDSVDFIVFADNFYFKHTDIDDEVEVSVYDADLRLPLPHGDPVLFSPTLTTNIYTVPTGGRYYVASTPIEIGEGTNVQMRSIGEQRILSGQRGADLAVDLALWEMTTVADTLNPALRVIISEPNTNQADAHLGITAQGPGAEATLGARGWANESATMYAIANATEPPQPRTNDNELTTFASAIRWERSFIKEGSEDPRFMLRPMALALSGSGPGTNELKAFAEIVVEMRAFDISPAWQPVFFQRVEIAGNSGSGGNPSTFRITREEGDLPAVPLDLNGNFAAEYRQQRHKDTIDLGGIPNGHSFELRLRLNTQVDGFEGESGALARLGDPVFYGSGFRMEYNGFGELPRIKRVTAGAPSGLAGWQAAAQPPAVIEYRSLTNFYYRLYRGEDADTTGLPFAMKLGIDGDDSMLDNSPPANPTPEDYTLENQPIDQPLDFDSDGIDDVYELLRPTILNPLNSADAFADPDGDDRSNLEEYTDGTNPQVPDSPPTNPTLNFPGLIVPTYPGGELIDMNNDGLLDSAGGQLFIALAHVGGTFATATNSPLPEGVRGAVNTAYLKLDGDAFPDAVVVGSLTNRLFALRGLGDGTFTPLANYPAVANPEEIVLCNLNGDALTDVAIMSMNGRAADLHRNNGDGTLTQIATLTTNAFGTARGLALADFNNDGRDDVVLGFAANAVVFFSTNNTAYHQALPYPVGSSPESIAIGDLNRDGRLDIVTANRSSDDLSVLFGAPGPTFLPQTRYVVGDLPSRVTLADLNEDTFLDAVVSLVGAEYQMILLNAGNGTLRAPYTVPTGTFLTAVLDWDKDGNLDLVSSISPGGLVNPGNGDGTFKTRLQIVPTNSPPSEVTAVDLNADNKLELVGFNTQTHSLDIWEHAAVTGTNRLLASLSVGRSVQGYTSGDFNGDNRIDLAAITATNSFGGNNSNQVVILINQGGNFSFQTTRYPLELDPADIAAADFNGDGNLDLAVHAGGGSLVGGSRLISLLGNGSGGFQIGAPVVVATTISFMAAGNAEGDTRAELVVRGARIEGTALTHFLEVFSVDAAGGWTNRQVLTSTNTITAIQIASMNGDAFPDLVVTESDSATSQISLRMYPGSPAGFGAQQVIEPVVDYFGVRHIADLNADGRPDITAGNTLFVAKPGGGFHPGQPIWIGPQGVQHVADFNGDGKADLLNGLSILLQQ